jgi:ribosomal protein S18 acetylase RimI-like enzyme
LNKPATILFERAGFKTTRRLKDYYDVGIHGIRMTRSWDKGG